MKNELEKVDYVSKSEFKKSMKNMNLLLFGLCLCILYMWFFK